MMAAAERRRVAAAFVFASNIESETCSNSPEEFADETHWLGPAVVAGDIAGGDGKEDDRARTQGSAGLLAPSK
jgi:hypothetical protein